MGRKSAQKLRESDIKAALVDYILKSPQGKGDTVVVSEMPVSGSLRRADVVVANGRLHAFEIKSDVDRLVRLPGQLAVFTAFFELVTVVTVAKFVDRLGKMLPREVGLIVAEPRQSGPRLYARRRPRLLPLTREASIHYLNVEDLQRLAREHGLKPLPVHRAPLVRFATTLPDSVLRDAARAAIKRRYASLHNAYVSARAAPIACDPLALLRRPSKNSLAVLSGSAEVVGSVGLTGPENEDDANAQTFWSDLICAQQNELENSIPVNWNLLGGYPAGAPTHVLRRRRA